MSASNDKFVRLYCWRSSLTDIAGTLWHKVIRAGRLFSEEDLTFDPIPAARLLAESENDFAKKKFYTSISSF